LIYLYIKMTTEYYQIPSQQGFLPSIIMNNESGDSADPWLAAATSSLSLSDWSVAKGTSNKQVPNPPSLFEPEDVESSVSWKNIIPMQYAKPDVRVPIAPKLFNSTTSKIDAWSVVDNIESPQQMKSPLIQLKVATPQPSPKLNRANKQPVLEQPIEEELVAQNRYKTELCKSFNETGVCRYGGKCQFAHGKEEIRGVLRHPKYKTETCKTFHTTGTCPYGTRCRFIHTRTKEAVPVIKQEVEEDVDDDEIRGAAPPGIPVPEWSKSWAMSMASAVPSKRVQRVVSAPEHTF
jgi:butyrate response factor 1